ncbi:MAG: hypothetical protein WCS15_04370 [Prevotella sp.]
MSEALSVWVGAAIIYLYGTVNGAAATFTLVGDGYWQAVVPKSEDNNYVLYLEAYSENGLDSTYAYTLYYGMIPSVIDRTAQDVARANQLKAKIEDQGWAALTAEEQAEWLGQMKGIYAYSDLNRVEHNVDYLASLLLSYGYSVTVSPKHDWIIGEIPLDAQMTQYLADVAALKAKFYGTTALPAAMRALTYTDANNIEKLLAEIEKYINWMVAGFRKCGTFKSGQGVILP